MGVFCQFFRVAVFLAVIYSACDVHYVGQRLHIRYIYKYTSIYIYCGYIANGEYIRSILTFDDEKCANMLRAMLIAVALGIIYHSVSGLHILRFKFTAYLRSSFEVAASIANTCCN